MKERPILFSTPMVQALLNGRKNVTRRVMKEQEHPQLFACGTNRQYWAADPENLKAIYYKCPFGAIYDRLWVRETWCYVMRDHAHDLLEGWRDSNQYVLKSQVHEDWMEYAKEKYNYKWRPSIFMPRSACRFFLQIDSIRVERLHDISHQDLIDEGIRIPVNGAGSNRVLLELTGKNKAIDFLPAGCMESGGPKVTQKQLLFAHFAELWCSINGRESWDSNPWVWVIGFTRVNHANL